MDFTIRIVLFVVGLTILGLVWRRIIRRSGQAKKGVEKEKDGEPAGRSDASTIRESTRNLLLDIEEISRTVNGRLGTKIRVLDALLKEADQKIDRLETLTGKDAPPAEPQADKAETGLDEALRQVLNPRHADEKVDEIYRRSDGGEETLAIAKAVGLPRGEVELILSIRRRDGASGN